MNSGNITIKKKEIEELKNIYKTVVQEDKIEYKLD